MRQPFDRRLISGRCPSAAWQRSDSSTLNSQMPLGETKLDKLQHLTTVWSVFDQYLTSI
jgi:hypothetical protein